MAYHKGEMDFLGKENTDGGELAGNLRVGARLREIRQNRGLTLQQVAEDTGFALSFLSLLERDKVSISIDNLSRLSRFYGVRMVSLFENEPGAPVFVARAGELAARRASVGKESAVFSLLSDGRSPHLESLHIVIGPGGGDPEYRSHGGEAFLYVVEGAVLLLSEEGERVELSAGDAASYFGFPARRIANASQSEPAVLFLVTSPPTDRRDDVVDKDNGLILQSEED